MIECSYMHLVCRSWTQKAYTCTCYQSTQSIHVAMQCCICMHIHRSSNTCLSLSNPMSKWNPDGLAPQLYSVHYIPFNSQHICTNASWSMWVMWWSWNSMVQSVLTDAVWYVFLVGGAWDQPWNIALCSVRMRKLSPPGTHPCSLWLRFACVVRVRLWGRNTIQHSLYSIYQLRLTDF